MSFGRDRGAGGLRGLEPVRPGPGLGFRGGKTAVPTLRQDGLWRRALAKDSMLRHVDWILILAVLSLSLIGTLLVWSATAPGLSQAGANPRAYLEKQLLVVVIGLIMMTGVTLIDYRVLRMIAPFAYAAGLFGLLAVLSPLGTTINGSHSWIPLPGGFQIEPSEYAKIGLIMMIALIFGAAGERSTRPGAQPLALAVACTVPVIGLVLAEPDLGVAVVIVAISAGMIALSGVGLRWLALLTGAGALGLLAVLKLHLLAAYQVGRLTSFLHPSADPAGTGYQAFQAKIAIGSGGMFGQGLFHGQLTAGSFLGSYSFQGTDFIFAVAGEELGFVGCATIVMPMLMNACAANQIATPAATSSPNASSARAAIRTARKITRPSSTTIVAHPTKPSSSPATAKMKSVPWKL